MSWKVLIKSGEQQVYEKEFGTEAEAQTDAQAMVTQGYKLGAWNYTSQTKTWLCEACNVSFVIVEV